MCNGTTFSGSGTGLIGGCPGCAVVITSLHASVSLMKPQDSLERTHSFRTMSGGKDFTSTGGPDPGRVVAVDASSYAGGLRMSFGDGCDMLN
jgi:hypothetical protein